MAVATPGQAEGRSGSRSLAPGLYCFKERLVGYTGSGPGIPLGNFLMSVRVKRNARGHAVSFSNSMPDSQEILTAETDKARVLRDGSLTFDFQDGWENLGRARLYPTGKVVLVMVRKAPMNQIARNYGTFAVSKAGCRAEEFNNRR